MSTKKTSAIEIKRTTIQKETGVYKPRQKGAGREKQKHQKLILTARSEVRITQDARKTGKTRRGVESKVKAVKSTTMRVLEDSPVWKYYFLERGKNILEYVATRYVREELTAQDIVINTLAKCADKFNKEAIGKDGKPVKVSTYVYSAVVNACKTHNKSKKVRNTVVEYNGAGEVKSLEEYADIEDTGSFNLSSKQKEVLYAELKANLSPQEFSLIVLYDNGKSDKDICTQLGFTSYGYYRKFKSETMERKMRILVEFAEREYGYSQEEDLTRFEKKDLTRGQAQRRYEEVFEQVKVDNYQEIEAYCEANDLLLEEVTAYEVIEILKADGWDYYELEEALNNYLDFCKADLYSYQAEAEFFQKECMTKVGEEVFYGEYSLPSKGKKYFLDKLADVAMSEPEQ